MRLNSKVTWGLAWTGLAVVLAVPSADYLTGAFGAKGNSAALITSTTDPVRTGSIGDAPPKKTAAVTTRVTKTGVTIVPAGSAVPDPVNKLLKSGKPLPDYISDGDSTQAATTAPARTPATADESTQVATVDPTVPVVPFPRRPPDIARPALPKAAQPAVIVDENAIVNEDALAPAGDEMPDQLAVNEPDRSLPPAGIQDDWRAARNGRMTRYLEQNGLIDDGAPDGSSASVTVVKRPPLDYDPDGFYLSDGPNNSRTARRARIERLLQDSEDVSWF